MLVSLSEAKEYLRIDTDAEDSTVESLLIAIFKITNSIHNKKTIPYNQMV